MKLRSGFVLIEVLLSLAIGSILALLLFQSMGSLSKTYQKIYAVSSVQRRLTLLQQQFERDFSGIVAPKISLEDEREPDKKEEERKQSKEKKAQVKSEGKESKEKTYRVPHVFFSQNDGKGNCVKLTCLTTNPVMVYGDQPPRLVRVVYSLEPDPEHEGLFLLARQQSDNLDFKAFSKQGSESIKKFTISDGIASYKVSYLVPQVEENNTDKKPESKEDKKKEDKKKREFKTLTDWPYIEDKKEEEKSKRPSFPTFIKVEITLVDEQKRSSDFLIWYAPLYDSQRIIIEKSETLASMSDIYHQRFMERKMRNQQGMQHAMRKHYG